MQIYEKKAPTKVFSYEFCEIFKNTSFSEENNLNKKNLNLWLKCR